MPSLNGSKLSVSRFSELNIDIESWSRCKAVQVSRVHIVAYTTYSDDSNVHIDRNTDRLRNFTFKEINYFMCVLDYLNTLQARYEIQFRLHYNVFQLN